MKHLLSLAVALVLVIGWTVSTVQPAQAQQVIYIQCTPVQISQKTCDPEFAPSLDGKMQVDLEWQPPVCLERTPYGLMTEAMRNGQLVKIQEAQWDYAFWQGGSNPPYDIGTEITGPCFNHQGVDHGTVILNWFICKDRATGRWMRVWSATTPIVNNDQYLLVIYHREYVESFHTPPPPHANWPLPG